MESRDDRGGEGQPVAAGVELADPEAAPQRPVVGHLSRRLLPAGTDYFFGVVLIAMMTGRLVQTRGSLARVIIEAALLREESRGVHLRTDHPRLDDDHWNRHLWFQRSEAEGLERWGTP